MFAITCQADLNLDSTTDCVVGGMSGVRIDTDLNQTNALDCLILCKNLTSLSWKKEFKNLTLNIIIFSGILCRKWKKW